MVDEEKKKTEEEKKLIETLSGDDTKVQKHQVKSSNAIDVEEALVRSEKILSIRDSSANGKPLMEFLVPSEAILNIIKKIEKDPPKKKPGDSKQSETK